MRSRSSGGLFSGLFGLTDLGSKGCLYFICSEDAATDSGDRRIWRCGLCHHVASGKPVVMRDLLEDKLEENNLDISIVRETEEKSNRAGYDVPKIYIDMQRTSQLTGIKL